MITRQPTASDREDACEGGFTLVEVLVVIIIIGILAAISIPIFLNQLAVARDSGTTSDARNLAMNLFTLTASNQKVDTVTLSDGYDDPEDTEFTATSNSGSSVTVSKTEGTVFSAGGPGGDTITLTSEGHGFGFSAWNENGAQYVEESPSHGADSIVGMAKADNYL